MSQRSTRVWLEEELWEEMRRRSIAKGTTVRELIPHLLGQALSRSSGPAEAGERPPSPPAIPEAEGEGPPTVPLAEEYRCGVCGGIYKLGGLSTHLRRHSDE